MLSIRFSADQEKESRRKRTTGGDVKAKLPMYNNFFNCMCMRVWVVYKLELRTYRRSSERKIYL